ncbi:serine-rich adhesin for platelets isoform X2 [Parasteatoda tepidariorum]|uniref:serine-rich adhesin for platelets isoform X2 n=1 Tax=Parasteatoda tepidariorum TaxID=114398 RepID=UPI001C7268CA|nr:uncharacterized protein LOC107446235 isoform X2 [Parasteatoda tepidariorum]
MRWSRSPSGACRQHSEVVPSSYRNVYPRRPQHFIHTPHHHSSGPGHRLDWTEAQDTYICCAYSPRCFIIQKVKPSSQSSEDICEKESVNSTNIQDDDTLISTFPVEPVVPTNNDHVSNIHPGSYQNQTTAEQCSSSNFPLHNLETVEMATGERVSLTSLKELLRRQLEYYFSRENLQTDEYLQSQMDSDGYVAISTVAKFNQVRRLTDNHNLVVEVLRESAVVQVDEAGEKVRSNPRSGVLILREIPESTPLKELEELFSSENCPKFLRCEFAHNNSWYVLFESDADTQKAYQYLREEAKTFHGKPVMARIKAKAFTSAPFTNAYKNGAPTTMEPESYNTQNVNQAPQTPLQYTYTNVPNDSYNNQQVCPPFYPPTMLQTWAPTTPACVDLGTVLSVNGLSPQAAFRPLNNSSNRHNYASRDNEQSRYFNRNQSASYLQRQQLHQQASFPNIVNTNNCTFDYVPYASRSRNIHNFGVDMSFFTAPNLYYNKLPSIYPAHTSQTRHNPVIVPRNQVGIGAINSQDQSYLSVGNNASLAYSRDSGTSANTSSKQGGENQTRENWMNANRQRNKRWWKENGPSNSGRNYSENSNGTFNKSQTENEAKPESPKFDLETTSFPPLPGSACLETVDVDVYESRLSDIVKGTVKPATRDTKTQTSESALVCTTKDSSTITVVDEAVIPTDGAFTPPASPESVKETVTMNDALIVDNFQEPDDWEEYADSPNNSTPSNTSININSVVPEVQTTFSASNTPAFLSVSTNSMMNGSVTMTESATSTTSLPDTEPITNVPSEIVNESKQTATVKLPKAKQFDSLPKNRPLCDTPSPKNKTPDSSSVKNKFDTFKDRSSVIPKHSRTFSNSKESSFKERVNDVMPPTSKTIEHNVSNKCAEVVCSVKDKTSKRVLESNSNKNKTSEPESSLLSVNGHADSESTASSEDEKPFRKLTYSEVAMRAKEKVEKIAQELKEKERQEAMVRQHRQQDVVTQNRQPAPRGPFREFPRGRIVEARPGSKEWKERRKPARAISLPATGQ